MEITFREIIILVSLVFVVAVVWDGWRRMKDNKNRLKIEIDSKLTKSFDDDYRNPELPNGGARVADIEPLSDSLFEGLELYPKSDMPSEKYYQKYAYAHDDQETSFEADPQHDTQTDFADSPFYADVTDAPKSNPVSGVYSTETQNISTSLAGSEEPNEFWENTESEAVKSGYHAEKIYEDGFNHTDFEQTDLEQANLEPTDLELTDLGHADLEHTNLEHADLEHADLEQIDIEHPDVEPTKEQVKVEHARIHQPELEVHLDENEFMAKEDQSNDLHAHLMDSTASDPADLNPLETDQEVNSQEQISEVASYSELKSDAHLQEELNNITESEFEPEPEPEPEPEHATEPARSKQQAEPVHLTPTPHRATAQSELIHRLPQCEYTESHSEFNANQPRDEAGFEDSMEGQSHDHSVARTRADQPRIVQKHKAELDPLFDDIPLDEDYTRDYSPKNQSASADRQEVNLSLDLDYPDNVASADSVKPYEETQTSKPKKITQSNPAKKSVKKSFLSRLNHSLALDDPNDDDSYDDEQYSAAGVNRPKNSPAPTAVSEVASAKDSRKPKEAPKTEDVLVITVVGKQRQLLSGDGIKKIVTACGMCFGDMSIFHRFEGENEKSPIQFSMANAVNPGVFEYESMDEMETPAVTFFMSMLEPDDPLNAFECMLATAEILAKHLQGDLWDEDRSVMREQTKEHYRQRVRDFEMQQRRHQFAR